MRDPLTNLLPSDRKRALARVYRFRLAVVGVILATILIGFAAILLVPTYVYLTGSEGAKRTQLATIESTLSPAENATLSARITALSNSTNKLSGLAKVQSVSATIRTVLALPRPGVTLSNLAYTPPTEKALGALVLSGTAVSRDALRSYQLAIQNAPFARSAALPVSAYAKDTDIPFSITITLAP